MLRAFRFRLRPTRHQAETLTQWLAVSCELYDAALEERREAWKVARQRITALAGALRGSRPQEVLQHEIRPLP